MSLKKIYRRKASLAFRLTIGSAFITGIVFFMTFALIYASLASSARNRVDDRLRHEAAEMTSLAALDGTPRIQNALSESTHAEGTETVLYRIVTRDGEKIAESDTSTWAGLELDMDTVSRVRDTPIFSTNQVSLNSEPVRVMYLSWRRT